MVVYSQDTDEIMNQIEWKVGEGKEEYLPIGRDSNATTG